MPTRIRILDHVVEIAPDLARGELIATLYRHLLTEVSPDARLEIAGAGSALLAARLEGEAGLELRRPLPPGADPLPEAHRLLLEATLGRERGHCVLHAGAVASGGRALLVLGASWAGKTTLVEALLQRGFALLSDDYAPLRAPDLRVVPFPRALGRRVSVPAPQAPPLLAREWTDPHDLAPLVTEPVPVGAVVVLEEASPTAPPAALRPLAATETLVHLLAALRNPDSAPDAVARLAALAASVPAARLPRGPVEAMARAAAALLG